MNEWALMNKLPNEFLVDEGRLAFMDVLRLGLTTQFQYEERGGLTDETDFRYLNSCQYDNVPW